MSRPPLSPRIVDGSIAFVLLYFLGASIWEAAHRAFWFDELFTVYLAGLPSMRDVLDALGNATDTSGPLFYVYERLAIGLPLPQEVAYRLPSIVAATVTAAAVYVFARRDLGAWAGAVSVLVMFVSQLFHGYSVEARAYALMTMFIAVAAVAWQRVANRWWGVVLAVAIASAVATHYYAIFALVPFGLAEAVHLVRRRSVRVAVWIAFAAGAATLDRLWHLLTALRSYYGANYWSPPTIGRAMETYDQMLAIGLPGAGFGLALAMGGALLGLFIRLWPGDERLEAERPAPETLALIMGLLALPFIIVGVASVSGGGFTYRYAIGMLPGLGLSVAYALRGLGAHHQRTVIFVLASVLVVREMAFWASGGNATGFRYRPQIAAHQRVISAADVGNLPLVVSSGIDYLPLAFYASATPGVDIVALTDPAKAREYLGHDSIDLDLMALRQYSDLNIQSFDEFRQRYSTFMVLDTRAQGSWWPSRLLDEGYRMSVLVSSGGLAVYKVQAPESADGF